MGKVLLGHDCSSGEPMLLGDMERRSGLYVLGKPGMGKSNLLLKLVKHDLEEGHGLFFIDPHGDAIEEVLDYCERDRLVLLATSHWRLTVSRIFV